MRRDPNRVYYQPPETAVDYHQIHSCKECSAMLWLDAHWHKSEWYVVTRCRCEVYSTERGPYTTRAYALRKCRRMYAGLDTQIGVAA